MRLIFLTLKSGWPGKEARPGHRELNRRHGRALHRHGLMLLAVSLFATSGRIEGDGDALPPVDFRAPAGSID